MTLELLICTIDAGIENIPRLLLTPIQGVSYLVSWQHSDNATCRDLPQELMRADVKVVHLEGRGLSRNRNNAIDNASGDICMVADDDCTYRPEYFENVISAFRENQSLDIAVFQMKHSHENKFYPKVSFDLHRPAKGYFVTSFEIAFRRTSVQGRVRFNELFGLGAPVFRSGEECIFINDALQAGLNCRYIPVVVVEHDHPTTSSTRAASVGYIMGEGAVIARIYPWTSVVRLPLKAYRLNKQNHLGFFSNLRHLIAGIRYIL